MPRRITCDLADLRSTIATLQLALGHAQDRIREL
jgi:hypothetical protein